MNDFGCCYCCKILQLQNCNHIWPISQLLDTFLCSSFYSRLSAQLIREFMWMSNYHIENEWNTAPIYFTLTKYILCICVHKQLIEKYAPNLNFIYNNIAIAYVRSRTHTPLQALELNLFYLVASNAHHLYCYLSINH